VTLSGEFETKVSGTEEFTVQQGDESGLAGYFSRETGARRYELKDRLGDQHMVLGSKNVFAVEYEITQVSRRGSAFGKVSVWLNNKYLGCFEDESNLFPTSSTLLGIAMSSHKKVDPFFVGKSNEEVFDIMVNHINDPAYDFLRLGQYTAQLGEPFDDFNKRVFSKENKVVFMWKLDSRGIFSYPDYPEELQVEEVLQEDLYKVAREFDSRLREAVSASG
jgi:hypothetical protein